MYALWEYVKYSPWIISFTLMSVKLTTSMERNRGHRWWLLNLSEAILCSWYTVIFDERSAFKFVCFLFTSEKSVRSIHCQPSLVIATLTSKIKKSTKTKMNYLPCLLQFQTDACSGNPICWGPPNGSEVCCWDVVGGGKTLVRKIGWGQRSPAGISY